MRFSMNKGVLALCGLGLVMAGMPAVRTEASPRTEALARSSTSGDLTLVVSPARDARKIEQLKRSLEALPGVRRVFLGPTNGDAVELQMAGSAQIDGQSVQRAAEQLGFTVRALSVANAASGFQSPRNSSTVGGDPFSVRAFALGRRWFGSGNFRAFNRHSNRSAAGSSASNAATPNGPQGATTGSSSDSTASGSAGSSAASGNAAAGSSSSTGSTGGAANSSSAGNANGPGSTSGASSSSAASGASGTSGTGSAVAASSTAAAAATTTAAPVQGPIQRVAFLAGPVPSRLEAAQLIQTFASRPGVRDVIILPMPGRRGVAQISLAVDSSASAKDIRTAAESIGISVEGTE